MDHHRALIPAERAAFQAGGGRGNQTRPLRVHAEVNRRLEALPELIVSDGPAWRRWLGSHHADSPGVRVLLAKKVTTTPTQLTYGDALEEALSHGWIDGQGLRRAHTTYSVRFTPRRRRNAWAKRNTVRAERLLAEGGMHAAGIAEMERAKSDGRWQAAYHSSASIEVPDDLVAALDAEPAAKGTFATLSAQNRYAVLYRIQDAKRAETRARRTG